MFTLTNKNSAEWHHVTPHYLAPLEKICSGLGISLSQFFQEEDSVYLTKEQKELNFLTSGLSSLLRKERQFLKCCVLSYI